MTETRESRTWNGMVDDIALDAPMATRTLQWKDGAAARDVVVRIWAPVSHEPHGYSCRFSIGGLPVPVDCDAPGADSFQALMVAISGIRETLTPYREHISWFELAGVHGVPLIVDDAESST